MLGWFGDLGRLSWGLLYWNARKSLFRIRGASGAAPCQHPSDSGAAGKTGCIACLGWRDRRRFLRLCPLLTTGADGRAMCSVAAAQVRPFWGRAFALFGGSLAALAVASVLGAFLAFRAVGYRVPLSVVAWPPAWHRIRTARGDYYYTMALQALRSGDARKGFLALSHAYVLDPGNMGAARLLAQVTQVVNPDYSDEVYSQLLLRHDRDFEDTAEAWFRALVARGDFRAEARLSARMLREGAAHVPAWTQGLLFAEKMGAGPAEIDGLLAAKVKIPEEARSVLSLAAAIRDAAPTERMGRLEVSLGGGSTPFEVYYSLRRLEESARAADVVRFLDGPEGAAVLPYDREVLRLDAYSIMGWDAVERREVSALLDQGSIGPVVILVSAHLIRYPSPETAGLVFSRLDARPLPATAGNAGAHMALLCMAGVNGMDARSRQEARILGGLVGGNLASWDRVRESLGGPKNPAEFLPLLSELPLEVEYALLTRHRGADAQRQSAAD